MKLKQGSRLLFTGDSVTDVGRNRPVAQGTLFDPLGKGYPHIVSGLINAVYPGWGIHVINSGNSGDTSRRLAARWQTDVLDFKPDWVSVMIGINDVWRQFDSPCQPEEQVGPEEYEETLDGLFRRLRRFFVMLPGKITGNNQNHKKQNRKPARVLFFAVVAHSRAFLLQLLRKLKFK